MVQLLVWHKILLDQIILIYLNQGQFGTRLLGGKDSASERYIFTQLNKLTRLIFPAVDDPILHILMMMEHQLNQFIMFQLFRWFLLMVQKELEQDLVLILCVIIHIQIINKLTLMLKKERDTILILNHIIMDLKGSIKFLKDERKYLIKGIYEKIGDNKIHITELPVGQWTEDYKIFLENLMDTKKKD